MVQQHAAFVVELEGPIVHIRAADQSHLPVRHDAFGVEEAGGVFIDLHAVAQKLPPVSLGHHVGKLVVVRNAGDKNPHVHPRVGGDAQGFLHGLLHGVIGGGEVEHLLGGGDELQIDFFNGIVRVVQGPVGKGLAPAPGAFHFVPGAVVVVLVVEGAPHHLPHLHELGGEPPDPRALDADGGVLPVSEADDEVGVFVGDVDAPGIGELPVDDGDFPVIPVVEVDAVHIAVNGVEGLHLNARVLEILERLVGKAGEVAEIIEGDVDFHAGGGPLLQNGEDAVPELSLRQDVVLQKNIDLRLLQVLDQVLEKLRALLEIDGVRVPVEQEAPLFQVRRQPSPGRGLPPEAAEVDSAGQALALPAGDGGHRLKAELLHLMGPAPEAEQNYAGHRHGQQKAHPHQLVGGAAGPLVDPDGHRRAGDEQQGVDKAGVLRQKEGDQKRGGDLGDHRQCAHGNAGKGGNFSLDPLFHRGDMGNVLMHGSSPPHRQFQRLAFLLYKKTPPSSTAKY